MREYLGREGLGRLTELVRQALAEKADRSELAEKADRTYVDQAVQTAVLDSWEGSY